MKEADSLRKTKGKTALTSGEKQDNWINDGGQNKGSKTNSEAQGMNNFQNKTGKAIHENT